MLAYLSIYCNIHNSIRRAHRNSIVVLGFLTIPKCKCCVIASYLLMYGSHLATHESHDDVRFRKFHHQLLHLSLAKILESLKPGMTTPDIVHFPDDHFRKVIYGLGPYIRDYPEQALLACIVQGWCPKHEFLLTSYGIHC